jgi:hypothetical protein
MSRGLSQLQQSVLADLLLYVERVEADGNDYAKNNLCHFGVPVPWLRGRKVYHSPADRAAFSRMLARMERRGLIIRRNGVTGLLDGPRAGLSRASVEEPHTRTTGIILTDTGRKTAEQIRVNKNTHSFC